MLQSRIFRAGVIEKVEFIDLNGHGSANIDITSPFGKGFKFISLVLHGLTHSGSGTVDASLQIRFSNDGGSTFKSGASDYGWAYTIINSVFDGLVNNDGHDRINTLPEVGASSLSNKNHASQIDIFNADDADKSTIALGGGFDQTGDTGQPFSLRTGGGAVAAAEVNDAIRLFCSQTIDDGKIEVYGWR